MKALNHTLDRLQLAGIVLSAAALMLPTVPANAGDEHGHDEESGGEHGDEIVFPPDAFAAYGITIATATRAPISEVATVPARVEYNAEAMAHVGTPISGRAIEILVRLGDTVQQGDLLVVVESPEMGTAESDLLQQRSMREAAASALEVARVAYQRAEELRKTNSISVTELLARQTELMKAEGELKIAVASYVAAENHLKVLGITRSQREDLLASGNVTSRYELRAPISGKVVRRELTQGEFVGPDRGSLLVLANTDYMWVMADVPERLMQRVSIGTEGRIVFDALDEAAASGTVTYVSPEMNPRTRTAQFRLAVDTRTLPLAPAEHGSAPEGSRDDHADGGGDEHGHEPAVEHDHGEEGHAAPPPAQSPMVLRPGMFAHVDIALQSSVGAEPDLAIAVPEAAVQTVEGRDCVFVPSDEPNTYKPAPVRLGRRIGSRVEVLSGLNEGDKFIASGSYMFKAEQGKSGAEHEH